MSSMSRPMNQPDFEQDLHLVPAPELENFAAGVLGAAGVPEQDARLVAHHLVEANLRGVDSHGISRLGVYARRVKMGLVAGAPEIRVLKETPVSALVHGGNGLGMVVAARAMEIAITRAGSMGIGLVGVTGSNHCGALAHYTMLAAGQNLIGFAATSAPASMAPWGGKEPYFGTNPFSLAVPVAGEHPIVLDMATSVVARGKIILARKNRQPIPAGWALDRDGVPTTDPVAALEGLIMPVGGPKGYALALLVDLFSGVMTGSTFGSHIPSQNDDFQRSQNLGHFFMAMRPDLFILREEFERRVVQMIAEVKGVERATGVEEVFLPGEPEFLCEERRREAGVPIARGLAGEMAVLGREFNVPLPAALTGFSG